MQLMQTQGVDPERDFGSYLRTERELRQIPLYEVSVATKIPLRALENLEAGRWNDLPADIFVRGFVRSYARHVGFSEQEASSQYEVAREARQEPATDPLVEDPGDTRPTGRSTGSAAGRGRFELALFVIIVLILATITLSLLWRGGEPSSVQAMNSETAMPSLFDNARS